METKEELYKLTFVKLYDNYVPCVYPYYLLVCRECKTICIFYDPVDGNTQSIKYALCPPTVKIGGSFSILSIMHSGEYYTLDNQVDTSIRQHEFGSYIIMEDMALINLALYQDMFRR